MTRHVIGLDFGSASARGVLLEADTGRQIASHVHAYRHDTLTTGLPCGEPLAHGWALQVATDYTEAAEAILSAIGRGREVAGIGIGFTASSPMPTLADGTPLSVLHPEDPHAYVKLWKHGAAQGQADRINATGGAFMDRFGGKVSGEWLLAKAAQIAEESPESWDRTERFIEAGDWLVWQLTGHEVRSLGFAAYKAQYDPDTGYPDNVVPGLATRLGRPEPVGNIAGHLSSEWLARTGIIGPCAVAVAVIDSHVVLPAIGAVDHGCFVGALGTSAVSLMLTDAYRPLPEGIEGTAHDGSIRGLWCYEAGQASFGDMLSWFVNAFPRGADRDESFAHYNAAAGWLAPGENRLLALDWWNGNRVPHANSALSGLFVGLTHRSDPVGMYRALLESLCFGMRLMVELYEAGGFEINRVVMTSGLAARNPLLIQIMADVLGRDVEVPEIANPTAVGAAIHGAVASGLVADFGEGAARFGTTTARRYRSDPGAHSVYTRLYRQYEALTRDPVLIAAMTALGDLAATGPAGIRESAERVEDSRARLQQITLEAD
ncbi:L-ribulokinase [Limimaricola variabilis]|uniref:L-ribulokinase n=1 Tax=Limimaricola variabilis TaxID=1492771 RepID=A0ABR6HRF7_9RHOB|nr:FGGY-family carbohydrate kinase [Limimaricola variabilis]MBB3713051.1 L-ribulokinase [Limimaricola variabilis]